MRLISFITRYIKFFWVLVFTSFLSFLINASGFDIDLNLDWQKIGSILDTKLPDKFLLSSFDLESDLSIDNFEKNLLFDFEIGKTLSRDKIKFVLLNLRKKSRFESVRVELEELKPNNYKLFLRLKSFWIFSKVKIKTRISDKNRYLQSYLLKFGEKFDKEKHQHSVEKIKSELQADGYLGANVIDEIKLDEARKTVSVNLTLENLKKFVINSFDIKITSTSGEFEDKNLLHSKLLKIANSDLNNSYYNKAVIDKFAQTVKNYLFKHGYFVGKIGFQNFIDYKNHKVKTDFSVELAYKKKLIFFGNHFFDNNQLISELVVFGQSALLMPASMLVDQLETLYKKRGFWDIKIDYRDEQGSYYFVINEGCRAKIDCVEIIGASLDSKLDNKLENNYQELINSCFGELTKSKFFDSQTLKQSLDKLKNRYMQDGFWDFSVIEQKFVSVNSESNLESNSKNSPENNSGNYKLILQIEEGPQRLLGQVEIERFPELLQMGPFADFYQLKTAVPFNINIIKEQRDYISNYLKQNGYIYTYCNPEFVQDNNTNNNSGLLKLVWKIVGETKPVRFGKTIIQTNSKVPTEIIMRELDYKEGQIWSKEKLERSLKNLKNLSMFEYVTLAPSEFNKAEENKDIILKALSDDPFEIRTRIGFQLVSNNLIIFNGGYSYKLGGSLLWKNPFNRADILRVDADFSRYKSDVVAAYEVPWIFGSSIRTTFKGYRSRYDQPFVFGSPQILYKASQEGILVELNKNFSHCDFVSNFGFEFMKISDLSRTLAAFIDYCPILVDCRIPYLFFEPSIFIDHLDNKLEPSHGSLTVMSSKLMGAPHLPRSYFFKILFERSNFYPILSNISNNIVGAFRLRFGYIFNPEFSNINPIERFYLGGAYSVRGYEQDKAPPVNFTKLSPTGQPECIVQLGGKAMVNINTELRFPIYQSFSGVVFNDIGALAQDKITDIITSNFVGSTGFGLRYNTPVGALRFDLGFKWKKRFVGDSPYAWFLTLGEAF